MSTIRSLLQAFIKFSKEHYVWIARLALFVVFFYFGFLKIIGVSPAGDLAIGFATKMGMGDYAHELYFVLAIVECLIGIAFLIPRLTLVAVSVMLAHMVLVSAPIVLYPEAVWTAPFVPNLEGQYIIKNLALAALALSVVAALPNKRAKKR